MRSNIRRVCCASTKIGVDFSGMIHSLFNAVAGNLVKTDSARGFFIKFKTLANA
jgi:hypothetical protein